LKKLPQINGLTVATAMAAAVCAGPGETAFAFDSAQEGAFLSAVWSGDVGAVRHHLADGADPATLDDSGMNALEIAETLGDSTMVLLLMQSADSHALPVSLKRWEAVPLLQTASLPETRTGMPFDLAFSPATGDGIPILVRLHRPSRDTLAETAALVRQERAAREAEMREAAASSVEAADVPPEPEASKASPAASPEASSEASSEASPAASVADRFIGWLRGIFDGGETVRTAVAEPGAQERGRAATPVAVAVAPGDRERWTTPTEVAATETRSEGDDAPGATWLASVFEWRVGDETATPVRRDERFTRTETAGVEAAPAEVAEIEWADETTTDELAIGETASDGVKESRNEQALTFSDLFDAVTAPPSEPEAVDERQDAEAAPTAAPPEPEATVATAAPVEDSSVVIGRMFSDPYGGAIPEGTPVPVYDDSAVEPAVPERKPRSRRTVEDSAVPAPAAITPPAPETATQPVQRQLAAIAQDQARGTMPAKTPSVSSGGDGEDKGLVIYIRGTVPSEKLYLGGDQRLGRAYGSDSDPARACAMRRSGETWICPEAALWPADVAASFARARDDFVESIVRYDDAKARQFRISFPSGNYDRILAHFIARLGEPTGSPEIWSPVIGSAPQENRVARWIANAEDEHGLAVLEIRSIDDLRWMLPPDPANGVVRLYYKGAKPIYSMVSNADLRLLEVRRIAAGDDRDDAVFQ